uniref:AlNc14C427G11564 protein n=1 Tax=Albugo laibachii Nc14 TaxID=890382 RepID=F0WZG5_9STRA|nr:AlNc14C427G11564 [Albugo laibachii Nc14]|eukprot:CCA26885.1 AlNc14C427G11564 [Albugo laibachii Nc14]
MKLIHVLSSQLMYFLFSTTFLSSCNQARLAEFVSYFEKTLKYSFQIVPNNPNAALRFGYGTRKINSKQLSLQDLFELETKISHEEEEIEKVEKIHQADAVGLKQFEKVKRDNKFVSEVIKILMQQQKKGEKVLFKKKETVKRFYELKSSNIVSRTVHKGRGFPIKRAQLSLRSASGRGQN